jgi:hypothetical protein
MDVPEIKTKILAGKKLLKSSDGSSTVRSFASLKLAGNMKKKVEEPTEDEEKDKSDPPPLIMKKTKLLKMSTKKEEIIEAKKFDVLEDFDADEEA